MTTVTPRQTGVCGCEAAQADSKVADQEISGYSKLTWRSSDNACGTTLQEGRLSDRIEIN